jgi:Tat protein translocase TatB subunit
MFGIGMPEMILIMAIALIVIGPKKLPDLAKSLGKAFREFKKATSDFKESLHADDNLNDINSTITGINDDVKDALDFKFEKKNDPLSKSDDESDHKKDDLKMEKPGTSKGPENE